MNSNELAAKLNSRVLTRFAPSKIHGVGIFALRDLNQGRKMYLDNLPEVYNLPYSSFGKLLPQVRQLLLERWPQIVYGSAFMYPDGRYQAYINHSDDQNYDGVNDVLIRDVKAGEEITEDYRKIAGWEIAHPYLKNSV